jgi:hypothetical protein
MRRADPISDFRPSKQGRRSKPSRRDFFGRIADGLHGAALASLLGADLYQANSAQAASPIHGRQIHDLAPKQPHFEPKAKAVIQLFMNGGPSQIDMFDPKPVLEKYAGTAPTRDLISDILFSKEVGGLLPSSFKFSKHGQSGMEFSELVPRIAECADDISMIRSMYTNHTNHEPAIFTMQGGRIQADRPALGAWVCYGLGSENQNLPAYVVLDDPKGLPINGIQNWQSAYLPPVYQGTRFRSEGPPVVNLDPRPEWPKPVLEAQRNLLRWMDDAHRRQRPREPNLDARIASYELAARMQMAATDALDLSKESEETKETYGLNDPVSHSFGKRCLMARRLVERGVRFVQIYIEGQIWDNHFQIDKELRYCCGKTDQPSAALVKDLKQRGLLDDTLVVWGGEFGRLPIAQTIGDLSKAGRDHSPSGFSVWMAGGGAKGGVVHGATDEIGHKAVEGRVSVHDFHATILHLLGLNNRDLTFPRHGLDERLTDQFPARVVDEIIA